MTILTRTERLALLVNLMGDDAAALARTGLSGDSLEELESALSDFKAHPPNKEEIDLVVEDFTLLTPDARDRRVGREFRYTS